MNMKNAITYKNRNGYLYPLLALPAPEETPIGKYGRMYLDYLKKHRRGTYTSLLTDGKLASFLVIVDQEIREQVKRATECFAVSAGITESLKESDSLAWTAQMNAFKVMAEETLLQFCYSNAPASLL